MDYKKITLVSILIVLLLTVIVSSAAAANTTPRYITWNGQQWWVRDGIGNPSNNHWSNTNDSVWVDSNNKLHLTIKKVNGIWYSTDVESKTLFGYGTYKWTVDSPIMNFDPNVVAAMFYYLDDTHELDIEGSRWGEINNQRLWYSVQPYSINGNEHSGIPSNSPYISATNVVYQLDWQPTYIRFSATLSNGVTISDWKYTNLTYIPKNAGSMVMNLWQFNNKPPSDGKNVEMIISNFQYTPTSTTPTPIPTPKHYHH